MDQVVNYFHLHPGEIFLSSNGTPITTLLGSCVAVCFWDGKKKIGGMNHVVLPKNRDDEAPSSRFANVATFVLYDMMIQEGCRKEDIRTHVYGGANRLIPGDGTSQFAIGELNAEITLKVLYKLDMPVNKRDIGGRQGRKIRFNTITGEITMEFLKAFDFNSERLIEE